MYPAEHPRGRASAGARRTSIYQLTGERLVVVVAAVLLASLYARYVQLLPANDWPTYYGIAEAVRNGAYPFIDFWTEYPPVFPLLLAAAQRALGSLLWADQSHFETAYGLFMTGMYAINGLLVWDLVRIGYDARRARWALALYGACPLIAWFTVGWFDALALLWLLLGLRALVKRQSTLAGIAIGIGVLTKLFPGVLIVAAPAMLGWRGTLRLVFASCATMFAVLLPLALTRPDLLIATATSIATRLPWETLPAVIAGEYAWGWVAPLSQRFTAESARSAPSAVSGLTPAIQLATGLGVLGVAWYRTRRGGLRISEVYCLVATAICGLLLGSKGFSPQFLVWLLPLLLLVWPNRTAAMYLLAFTVYGVAYYMFWLDDMLKYFIYETATFEQLVRSAWLSAISRTMLLVILQAHLVAHVLRPTAVHQLHELRRSARPNGHAAAA